MVNIINKNFLEDVRMSDLPGAWILQAQGFYHSSKALLRGNTTTKGKKPKFISTEEGHIVRSCYKTACYLLAHTIELSLKAIYCLHGGDNVENYSHGILKLLNDLINKNIIKEYDVDNETFELASILLDWYGRYHRPSKQRIKKRA